MLTQHNPTTHKFHILSRKDGKNGKCLGYIFLLNINFIFREVRMSKTANVYTTYFYSICIHTGAERMAKTPLGVSWRILSLGRFQGTIFTRIPPQLFHILYQYYVVEVQTLGILRMYNSNKCKDQTVRLFRQLQTVTTGWPQDHAWPFSQRPW